MKYLKTKEFFRKLHHKKSIRASLYSLINIGLPFVGSYAQFIEIYRYEVTHTKVPIHNLPSELEGFRLVQISDLHFGPTNKSEKFLHQCVEVINQLNPDLIVMTGDFLQWDHEYIHPLAKILELLQSKLGTFASLGNHDYGVCHRGVPATDPVDFEDMIQIFNHHEIKVLHNQKQVLEFNGQCLDLVGLGDYWTPHFRPKDILTRENKERTTIVLSHNPDSMDHLCDYEFDLVLAGHCHGGQITLPLIGPLSMPVKNRHLHRGLHDFGKRWLYTNRGLGYTFKARFLSRPEIACLELVRA